MPDQSHGSHGDILRRLDHIERRIDGLRIVPAELMEARLDVIRSALSQVKDDLKEIQATDTQRRLQVYGAVVVGVVGLIVALIQFAVMGS